MSVLEGNTESKTLCMCTLQGSAPSSTVFLSSVLGASVPSFVGLSVGLSQFSTKSVEYFARCHNVLCIV